MSDNIRISDLFDKQLAHQLADKIILVYPNFQKEQFVQKVDKEVNGKTYTQRVLIIAEALKEFLPYDYEQAVRILVQILGKENPEQTGMFKNFYWVLPIGKFVQNFGLEHPDLSLDAIEEITKRNTGEYALRPYIKDYPELCLKRIDVWAQSSNFHLRRLASEGLRPKLPWAPKLDLFIKDPTPVFGILQKLRQDEIKFVQRSVANHLADYLKVNFDATLPLLKEWNKSSHPNTQWIIKHSTRKFPELRAELLED